MADWIQTILNTAYDVGESAVLFGKEASEPELAFCLAGRFYISSSGWGMLSVPNAMLRGAFAALREVGTELPYHEDGTLNGHISVLRPEDIESIGGAEFIKERGQEFRYTTGPVKTVRPSVFYVD